MILQAALVVAAFAQAAPPTRTLGATVSAVTHPDERDLLRPADQTAWERFGRELVDRQVRKTPAIDRSDFLSADAAAHRDAAIRAMPLAQLTARERDTWRNVFAPTPTDQLRTWKGPTSARMMPSIAPGVIEDTLAAAGCKLEPTARFGTGSLVFNPDGRPRTLQVDPGTASAPCTTAFTALGRLAVADADCPVGDKPQRLMLPLVPGFVAGTSEPKMDAPLPESYPGVISPPRKIRDVQPEYPQEAQEARIQGVVIVDSVIGTSGCVAQARIVRSIPGLDWAALVAVSQWGFEPARIDGRPVPVYMNVVVNFELR